jgi:tRNA nucleotidyltransferase (CCA-adding enzyme)
MSSRGPQIDDLAAALRRSYPELQRLAEVGGDRVFLVGGAVRDLLLGRGRADIDVAVVGNPDELATALGADTLAAHERFATAKVGLDGHELDIAAARTETYERPGALPTVALAAAIEADLGRRDFTINAMAIPLAEPSRLIDPHGGRADLDAGLLRVLHPRSFADDPTRALRAARYAARFGFALEAETERLLRATELDTVSAERRRAELLRLAAETTAPAGFALLAGWGLLELRLGGVELATAVSDLLAEPRWRGEVDRAGVVFAAACGPPGAEVELAAAVPERPSQAVALARGRSGAELVLARALGAGWIDQYMDEWRNVALDIDGDDLLAAGAPRGPALGRALAVALAAKLDGEVSGREQELALALAAAGAD